MQIAALKEWAQNKIEKGREWRLKNGVENVDRRINPSRQLYKPRVGNHWIRG